MDELMQEAAEGGKVPDDLSNWEKPEQFFITLGKERRFETRLKLWKFMLDFEPKVDLLKSQLKQLIDSFATVKGNKHIHEILRKILTIGNLMNAGDIKRGQADGFLLGDAFNKVTSLRSVDNESILKIVCKKMHEGDETFVENFKVAFAECYTAKKCVIEDISKGLTQCKNDAQVQKGQFETTIKQVPDLES
jgi:hypothetical protein